MYIRDLHVLLRLSSSSLVNISTASFNLIPYNFIVYISLYDCDPT